MAEDRQTTPFWSRFKAVAGKLYSQPASAIGVSVMALFILVALFGPLIAPYGANQQIAQDARQPPSSTHLFGTDNLGRDVFSRVVLGARDVLSLAGLGTLVAVILVTAVVVRVGMSPLMHRTEKPLLLFSDPFGMLPKVLPKVLAHAFGNELTSEDHQMPLPPIA